MEIQSILVMAVGVLTIAIAVMHIGVPVFIGWYKEINKLTVRTKRTIIDRNSFLILLLVIIAYICFVHSEDLVSTALGRSLLLLIGVYWVIRGIWRVIAGIPRVFFASLWESPTS